MSEYIEIRNWERFQHADATKRGKDPKWIKTYTRLLSDDAYRDLTAGQRAVLHGLWLEYARSGRELRLDTVSLTRRLNLRVTQGTLDALNHAGFLEFRPDSVKTNVTPLSRLEEIREEVPAKAGTPAPEIPPMVSPAKAKSARATDELWEALVRAMGRTHETEIERKRWNSALKELRDAGATAEDIHTRAAAYRREWPEIELTPHALAANWSRFGNVVQLRRFKCPLCEIPFTTEAKRDEHLENIHDRRADAV